MKVNVRVSRSSLDALPYVPGRKYGIVRVSHVYPDVEPDGAYEGTVAGAVAMQDREVGVGKGNTVPIGQNVWSFLKKINQHPRAMEFWESEGWLWINIPYKKEGKTPRGELIMSPGNIVSWDEENYDHVKLLSYDCNVDTSKWDPKYVNWKYMPDRFWKATSYNRAWQINNVGAGIDAYTMRIRNPGTDVWMCKSSIEPFPEGDYQYRLRGTDVYDGERPLMKVIKGQRVFYDHLWRLEAPGVIPPTGWS